MVHINLGGDDWQMKEFVGLDWVWRNSQKIDTKDNRWWYRATVPGSVLHDLWRIGKVVDPFYELNSKLAEWVPQRTWLYRKCFSTPANISGKRVTLCFDGIDYSSEIYLNGIHIGRQEGQFIPFIVDITNILLPDHDNLLAVVIDPAPMEQPQVGKTSLVRTHKTRMNYWWDFCPRMIHQGIWDSVYLKITGDIMIKDYYISSDLKEDLSKAQIIAELTTDGEPESEIVMEVNEQTVIGKCLGNKVVLKIDIVQPKLWYPNGYGEAYQYEIKLYSKDKWGEVSDCIVLRYGIRRVEFEKNEHCNEEADPFVLKVNGRRIYMKGYNWVPMDAMYGVEQPEKLHRLIRLAKEANTVMFRVWGGGLIEKDAFYEACAEHGILVWQEFIQSSSGIDNKPPEDPEHINAMIAQAESIIKRKRNHTSLAIWCGGNELSDWEGNPVTNLDPLIYALKEVVVRLDPSRRWLPSSPSGGVFNNTLDNIEKQPDMLWDVHGPWEHQGFHEHYELYNRGTSLLHSEFGVEGMTNYNTLGKSVSEEKLLPASKENEIYFHRGAWWTNELLVQEMFGGLQTIDQIRQASQYLQFEGLKYAVESNRRRAFQNSGTFPWQFNEPYPNNYCTSNIDYYANPKPVYYGVKKSYDKVLVSASYASPSIYGKKEFDCKLYVTTCLLEEEIASLGKVYLSCEILGKEGTDYYVKHTECRLPVNSTELVAKIHVNSSEIETSLFLLRVKLRNENGDCIAENEYLFTKDMHYGEMFQLEDPIILLRQIGDKLMVRNLGETALWYIFLSSNDPLPQHDYIYFDQNYFCLMPREEKEIRLQTDGVTLVGKTIRVESFQVLDHIILQ
jgi:beta-mannosidase